MWRLITILVLLLAAAVLVTVRFSGLDTSRKPDFSFINRGDHKTLDPNSMSWLQDIRIAYALWEGLYALDARTLRPIPGTADRIDLSGDQTVYTFHIRSDARWSDNSPVHSGDFVFAWRRMLEQPAEYVALFYYIKGAKDYQEKYEAWNQAQPPHGPPLDAKPDFAQVGIESLDDQHLRVTLAHPVIFFPALCAFPPFFPQNEASMRQYAQYAGDDPRTGRIVAYDQAFTRPPHLVSNGPYMLTEWSFKRRVRLQASPYYWDRANVGSKIIDEIDIEDPVGALRAYLEGRVDWLADAGELAPDLRKRGDKDLHSFTGFGTYFYSINCRPNLPGGQVNPFHDVRVRRAFAMAIDKKPVVDNVTRMGEEIATRYIPPGIFKDYRSPPGLAYDPAAARRLMAEAGYPDGKGFPRLTILFNNETPQHSDIAQVLRNQWVANLGVNLDLEGVEVKIFGERLHHYDYTIARASWIGDYDDPSTFTDKYRSDSLNNDSQWQDAAYDRLCDQAAAQTDPQARFEDFSRAEEILLDQVPIIPIYHYRNAYMFRANVHGIYLDPRNNVMFKSVWVTRP